MRNSTAKPFTFLEMAIAMALLLMVVSLLYAGGNAVLSSWQRMQRVTGNFSEVLTVDRVLDTALTNIVPFIWRDDAGNPLNPFQGQAAEMQFVYRHDVNETDHGGLRFAQLAVNDGNLLMTYRQRPRPQTLPEDDAARRSVLADNVAHLNIFYADWSAVDGLVWVEQWNDDGRQMQLPLAVLIVVHWRDGRWESWLRRTAGNGYRERWQPNTGPPLATVTRQGGASE